MYNRPTNAAEAEVHVNANWMRGTKAMVVKSVPIDEVNTVVFAIRGSQTFMDWAVNFREAPCSPVGFLVSVLSSLRFFFGAINGFVDCCDAMNTSELFLVLVI